MLRIAGWRESAADGSNAQLPERADEDYG